MAIAKTPTDFGKQQQGNAFSGGVAELVPENVLTLEMGILDGVGDASAKENEKPENEHRHHEHRYHSERTVKAPVESDSRGIREGHRVIQYDAGKRENRSNKTGSPANDGIRNKVVEGGQDGGKEQETAAFRAPFYEKFKIGPSGKTAREAIPF